MSRLNELRLLARVARLYYIDGLRQSEIAERLTISQAGVSRLITRARDEGIVRITIEPPRGTFPDLEERLCREFGLAEAVVTECSEFRDEEILNRIGEAAGHYVETTLQAGEVIGISSWSESLLRMVDNIQPLTRITAAHVVQILGGMGNPAVQAHATALTTRLAQLTHAQPLLLTTQGVAGSASARQALLDDPYVQRTLSEFRYLTLALVGIGAVEPSKLLSDSGNVFTREELAELAARGAVGDVCLRFFDRDGEPVVTPLDLRVIGISREELKNVRRVVGVAGGRRKVRALRGVLRSGLINVLITDHFTALGLVRDDAGEDAEISTEAGNAA